MLFNQNFQVDPDVDSVYTRHAQTAYLSDAELCASPTPLAARARKLIERAERRQ